MSSGIASAIEQLKTILGDIVPQSRIGTKGARFEHRPQTTREEPPRSRQYFFEFSDITHDGIHQPGDARRTVGLDIVIGYDVEVDTTELLIAQIEDYESITHAFLDCSLWGSSSIVDVAAGEEDILLAENTFSDDPTPHYLLTIRLPLTYRETTL